MVTKLSMSEKLFALLSPLVGGRLYFDVTPDDGPGEVPYLVVFTNSTAGREFYVEQAVPDTRRYRIGVTTVSKYPSDRDNLALAVEKAICEGGFPASAPSGGIASGGDSTREELYASQQFIISY